MIFLMLSSYQTASSHCLPPAGWSSLPPRIALISAHRSHLRASLLSLRIALISSTTRDGALYLFPSLTSSMTWDKSSPPPRIARILSSTRHGALRILGSLGSCFRIGRFSSPISRQGWEVFHRINQVRFFTDPIRSGSHRPHRQPHLIELLVFLLSYLTGLGGFLPIACSSILWFSSLVSHWDRRVFTNWSRVFLILPSKLGGCSHLRNWFFLLTFLSIGRRFFQPFHVSDTASTATHNVDNYTQRR